MKQKPLIPVGSAMSSVGQLYLPELWKPKHYELLNAFSKEEGGLCRFEIYPNGEIILNR